MDYAVAIVGAGPIGAVAAKLLAEAGASVVLIDRASNRDFKAGETLPPVANPILRRLRLWDTLERSHLRCPGNQSAFGSADMVELDFVYSANGAGWHLDRLRFEAELREMAVAAGAKLVAGNLNLIVQTCGHSVLTLDGGAQIRSDFVIDASGGGRAVCRRLGVEEVRYDKLAASIGIYACNDVQDHRTMVEAVRDGWWYSSGLPNGRRAAMFFSDSDLPSFRRVQADFAAGLQETLFVSKCLSDSGAKNLPVQFTEPALSAHSAQVSGPGWLAIGDAAMRFDPLSSQGLWTGFMAAERAANAILAGTEADLNRYAEWCQSIFQAYISERQNYYAMETRWPESAFWQRRQSASEQFLNTQQALA